MKQTGFHIPGDNFGVPGSGTPPWKSVIGIQFDSTEASGRGSLAPFWQLNGFT